MKRIKIFAEVFLSLVFFISCGNDGIYNEETNREAVKKKREKKDSIQKAESLKLDSLRLRKLSPVLK